MEASELLNLLLQANQLKRTVRTGWLQRGIVDAENVAAHSFGVSFTALVMAGMISEPLDLEAVMAMALLHDLAEAITSDIPNPAWQLLPRGVKYDVERKAVQTIAGETPFTPVLLDYWEQLQSNDSAEARLVHDCDKLDLLLQAFVYEQQTGNRQLGEFWDQKHDFAFAETRAVWNEISSLRVGE